MSALDPSGPPPLWPPRQVSKVTPASAPGPASQLRCIPGAAHQAAARSPKLRDPAAHATHYVRLAVAGPVHSSVAGAHHECGAFAIVLTASTGTAAGAFVDIWPLVNAHCKQNAWLNPSAPTARTDTIQGWAVHGNYDGGSTTAVGRKLHACSAAETRTSSTSSLEGRALQGRGKRFGDAVMELENVDRSTDKMPVLHAQNALSWKGHLSPRTHL